MAGEIQLNSTTMATESSGSITAELDTIRPNTTSGSLTLQGDSSNVGVTGLTIDSSGNATFAQTITGGTIGSGVVFPTKKLINHFVKVDRAAHSSVGEGFYSAFDTTITAESGNSCFKITFTSLFSTAASHSASYRIYVQKNGGSDLLCKTISNDDLIASFGSYPDTGKLLFHDDTNHAHPISFSHFDYTSHSAGDTMKYRFWFRTQGSDTLTFNQTSTGTTNDYQATGVTSIIIEEYEK